ncbi:MAG: alginate lyase family protein, partial [Geminicoccales bacterium]
MLLASLCAPAGARAADLPLAAFQVRAPDASYFDVEERMRRLGRPASGRDADASRDRAICAPPARIDPIDYYVVMPSFYDDRAGWERANAPFLAFENGVTALAADYVRTGNPCHAHALAKVLRSWAERGALLKFDYLGNSKQAWYAIAWAAASSGMAYSVVRAEPSLDERDKRVIEAWLARVARKQVSHKGGPTSCCNNHLYWRGLQAAIVGVVAEDDALFQYGVRAYRSALRDMNDDGSF